VARPRRRRPDDAAIAQSGKASGPRSASSEAASAGLSGGIQEYG
jgi:hypothetical protein